MSGFNKSVKNSINCHCVLNRSFLRKSPYSEFNFIGFCPCGFTKEDADKILYDAAAQTFETSKECLKEPSLETCNGGASEVERIKPVNQQIQMLEEMAQQGLFTKQEFEKKIRNTLGNL